MKVRYYADAEIQEWHDYTIRQLETIHDAHDISVEIHRLEERYDLPDDFPGEIHRTTAQNVYDRDLKNNRELAAAIDRAPSSVYRDGRTLDIAGHVALVDDDDVRWASTLQGDAYGHGPGAETETPLDFLSDVAKSPSNRFCLECLSLLEGNENFCPVCGFELP